MNLEITENDYAHWLFSVPGLGNRSIDKLLCSGMNCKEIYEANPLEFKGILKPGQIKDMEKFKREWDFAKEAQKLKDKQISFIPRIDKRFPEKLKNIPDPPFALYVRGELPDPARPSVAIIGARMCSEYGRMMARDFGRGLAIAGVQVISGMARGIDGISQKAALAAGGKSYGVVGCGVDVVYPEENREIYNELCINGGVISEFPPGLFPKSNFFPMRNRIISGLADVVLVIEARQKSGTQITVDTALEQGREVLAVPGRVTDRLSDGCNLLISQGAGIACGVDDVLGRLWEVKGEAPGNERGIVDMSGAGAYLGVDNNGKELTSGFEAEVEEESDFHEMNAEEPEKTLEEEILDAIDIIPVSTSQILESLVTRGIELSVPQLMERIMELIFKGLVIQDGIYFRKRT